MLSRIVMTTALAGLLAAGTMSVQAQQPTSSTQQAANPSGWTFNIAPYGWFANLNVTSNLPHAARDWGHIIHQFVTGVKILGDELAVAGAG
jgi:hypothetical protein